MSQIKFPLETTVFIKCKGNRTETPYILPQGKQYIIYENKSFFLSLQL